MRMLPLLSCTAMMLLLGGTTNRAEAQMWYGGSLRYGYPLGPSVTRVRGPFGGGVSVVQGPFGGGAVSVRGPFGGRVTSLRGPFGGGVSVVRPGLVAPSVIVPPVVVPPVVPQTVLNPAPPAAWPYSAGYLGRIPPGYGTLEIAATPYMYTTVLPPGSQAAAVGGVSLYANNGVFYQPYFLGGRTVYVVVER